MSKTDTTIYAIQFSGGGHTYDNPMTETLEAFKDRKGFTTMEEVIKSMNAWGGKYFIGTQDEYDTLKTPISLYYTINTTDQQIAKSDFTPIDYLKGGKVNINFDELLKSSYPDAVEKTKSEYDIWKAKNDADKALTDKIDLLKANTSPKIAAYIQKGEDYLNIHGGDVKAVDLSEYIGANGKLSTKLVQITVEGHKEKDKSIGLLMQVYDKFIMAIETGTEDSLKLLPFDTPTELNAEIDRLWKIENDKERKELSVKLNIPMDHFAVIDKYLMVVQGDEPEVAAPPVPVKKSRKKTK